MAAPRPPLTTENLRAATDFAGFQHEFCGFVGIEMEGVDYEQPTKADLRW
jgi:trans-2-enoyl-CoA reductase